MILGFLQGSAPALRQATQSLHGRLLAVMNLGIRAGIERPGRYNARESKRCLYRGGGGLRITRTILAHAGSIRVEDTFEYRRRRARRRWRLSKAGGERGIRIDPFPPLFCQRDQWFSRFHGGEVCARDEGSPILSGRAPSAFHVFH